MRIINVIIMMMWCLLGIMQIWNPNPYVIFVDIIVIIMSVYFFDGAMEGWGRSLKRCRLVLDGWTQSNKEIKDVIREMKGERNDG